MGKQIQYNRWTARDITLPTKVSIVKAIVFFSENWSIKKAECWRIDVFELWCWRRLESPLNCKKEIKPVNPKGKWKSLSESLTFWDPIDCSLPGSSVQGILQVRILKWTAISFSRGSSRPRDRTQVLQKDPLPSEPPGKPRTLEWVAYPLSREGFPTQELNRGLLTHRWILYQLSYRKAHILKEINPKYSLEGLILKLRLQ